MEQPGRDGAHGPGTGAQAAGPEPAVLVTGGAGYVAGPLVTRLLALGRAVIVLDNLCTSTGRTVPPAARLVRGSVGDAALLDDIFGHARIAAVFHLAADTRVGESMRLPLPYYRHNVVESLTLLERCVAAGAPPFIFSSSAAVYGTPERVPIGEDAPLQPMNPYGETKLVFERALAWAGQAHGLPWAALRYFNAAGAEGAWEPKVPETHLIPNVMASAAGGPPLQVFGSDYPTADGTCVRDYVHVADLADGHLAALRHLTAGGEPGAFNLGSGQGHSNGEVIAAVERVTGGRVPHTMAPRRAGDPAVLVADAGRARRVLGWRAARSGLDEIVADAWRAFRAAGAAGEATSTPAAP